MMSEMMVQPNSEYQKDFLRDDKKSLAFITGIGAGKTVAGIMRAMLNAVEWNPGERGYIVTPTYRMLDNVVVPEMKKWGIIGSDSIDWNASKKVLKLPNGSNIIMESSDNKRKIERLRGPNISWFWMDEGARQPKSVWDIMNGRLRTGQYRNAFITTTPKGFNWVYDVFIDKDRGYVISDVPTDVNPELPADYFERMENYEGQYYQQEIMGQFVQFEGLVHSWFSEDHIVGDLPDNWDETIYGLDWGWRNPTAVIVILKKGEEYFIADEIYERKLKIDSSDPNDEDLVFKLDRLEEKWGTGVVYCDPSEPENLKELKSNGFKARKGKNDVLPGLQKVSSKQNFIRVCEDCQNTINEFRSYQYKDDDKEKPLKESDHLMDALRYALFTDSTSTESEVSTLENPFAVEQKY